MAKETYFEKLQRPEWQKKRLEIFDRDNWTCKHCGDTAIQKHLHHRFYVSHRDPWEYPDWCFVTLCKNCHSDEGAPYEGPKEWEAMIDVILGDGSDGDVEFAGSFLECCRRSSISPSGLLRAIKATMDGLGSLESKIERFQPRYPLKSEVKP